MRCLDCGRKIRPRDAIMAALPNRTGKVASLAGIRPDSACRALRRLADKGLVYKDGAIWKKSP